LPALAAANGASAGTRGKPEKQKTAIPKGPQVPWRDAISCPAPSDAERRVESDQKKDERVQMQRAVRHN
jgi:hypothetical protein